MCIVKGPVHANEEPILAENQIIRGRTS
jgi:hypothetical protein